MSNLVDLQSQIEKLQKQADHIKAKEFQSTVREIKEKMRAFGITVKDLASAKTPAADKSSAPTDGRKKRSPNGTRKAKPASTVAPKYRGPDGQTWTGRGLTPRWLNALAANGQPKEQFLIAAEAAV
jgi:DNA-binding protein H-NS